MFAQTDFTQLANEFIQKNPNDYIGKLEYQDQTIWIKRRPFSKRTIWNKIQYVLVKLVLLPPLFYPTTTKGGPASLHAEAMRLKQFSARQIAVPKVIAVTDDFLLTQDVGIQLHQYLCSVKTEDEKFNTLLLAIQALNQLHRAELCHARPSFGDMTWQNGTIFFIDLEEDPLNIMSLAEAQARDVWLFFNNAVRYYPKQDPRLVKLFQAYTPGIHQETLNALHFIVSKMKLFHWIETIFKSRLGRDVTCALVANQTLEYALKIKD